MTNEREWGLSPEDAILRMQQKIELYGSGENELTGIDSDTAFILGYQTALHDYQKLTGPNPVEQGVVYYDGLEAPVVGRMSPDGPEIRTAFDINVSEKENPSND